MNDDFDETSRPELNADEEALLEEMPSLEDVGVSSRTFLERTAAAGLGFFGVGADGAVPAEPLTVAPEGSD